jgi:hypothetical protein
MNMVMDKIVKFEKIACTTGADLTTYVQVNYTVMDNSGSQVPKTIKRIMLKNSLKVTASKDSSYYLALIVTGPDGVIPAFGGSESALNTALTAQRNLIWMTEGGFIKGTAVADEHVVLMEPSTGRQLLPGQKCILCMLAMNQESAAAQNTINMVDCNIWYDY